MVNAQPTGAPRANPSLRLFTFCLLAFGIGVCVGLVVKPTDAPRPLPKVGEDLDWSAVDALRIQYAHDRGTPKTPIPPGTYKVVVLDLDGRVTSRPHDPEQVVTLQIRPRAALHVVKTD